LFLRHTAVFDSTVLIRVGDILSSTRKYVF